MWRRRFVKELWGRAPEYKRENRRGTRIWCRIRMVMIDKSIFYIIIFPSLILSSIVLPSLILPYNKNSISVILYYSSMDPQNSQTPPSEPQPHTSLNIYKSPHRKLFVMLTDSHMHTIWSLPSQNIPNKIRRYLILSLAQKRFGQKWVSSQEIHQYKN